MTNVAIKVESISKKYQIGRHKNYPTLRDKLIEIPKMFFKGPAKYNEFWALENISFEVMQGEVIGIVGKNGAGKSTLLKILARITEPTSGQITMRGRVASMLEVGTGFNPELTGRENIYLNGAIIGMKRREINQKFKDIVEFSGVNKFLDTPVKHYSSGMYVRLAFAVSAHLNADILLVDEVLAVGDMEFQKKCMNKMTEIASSGGTVVFVSHNQDSVKKLCDKCMLIDDHRLVAFGRTRDVLEKYLTKGSKYTNPVVFPVDKEKVIFIKSIRISDISNKKKTTFKTHEKIEISIEVGGEESGSNFSIWTQLTNSSGISISTSEVRNIDKNSVVLFTIKEKLLVPDNYSISLLIKNEHNVVIDKKESIANIEIISDESDHSTQKTQGIISGLISGNLEKKRI